MPTCTFSSYVEVTDVEYDLKLRLIVAGPSCLTHRLSNLLDILLRPFTKHVKSNLRDTTDFLNNLPNNVQPKTLLASFDIDALYSNIPHDLGIQAVEYWLEKYPEELRNRFSKDFVLDGIKFILENNTFSFNQAHYKQVKGTAMGTKVAPVYATLTIGYLGFLNRTQPCDVILKKTVTSCCHDLSGTKRHILSKYFCLTRDRPFREAAVDELCQHNISNAST